MQIFIEALKMAAKHEKPCFTFFAFLPPYIGVSGSLVSGMRKSVKRSIDWYQKFLISYLAARYSTVFVFHLKCLILLFWNVVEAIAGRARANSLSHVLGLHVFPGARGGLLTCRLAPNVRQAVACGVELGGITSA